MSVQYCQGGHVVRLVCLSEAVRVQIERFSCVGLQRLTDCCTGGGAWCVTWMVSGLGPMKGDALLLAAPRKVSRSQTGTRSQDGCSLHPAPCAKSYLSVQWLPTSVKLCKAPTCSMFQITGTKAVARPGSIPADKLVKGRNISMDSRLQGAWHALIGTPAGATLCVMRANLIATYL